MRIDTHTCMHDSGAGVAELLNMLRQNLAESRCVPPMGTFTSNQCTLVNRFYLREPDDWKTGSPFSFASFSGGCLLTQSMYDNLLAAYNAFFKALPPPAPEIPYTPEKFILVESSVKGTP